MAAGSIIIDLLMRTGSFETDTARAAKTAQQRAKQIDDAFKKMAVGIGAAFAASVTAVVAWTRSTVEASAEITRMAQLSSTTAEQFQRLAAGAAQVGVQNDKLADIFKDVQDKVGDFMQTGGGPLADFFEKIAPRVGVTAEQFRKLSGPDALQLYVSSLERANVTQSEMVFYLEAIASDATLLLPLLRNNGQGFKEAGDQAARYGAILSNEAIAQSEQLRKTMIQAEQQFTGLKRAVASETIPAIQDLANVLGSSETQQGFAAIARMLTEVASLAIKAAAEFGNFARFVGESVAKLANGAADPIERIDDQIADLTSTMRDAQKNAGSFAAMLVPGLADSYRKDAADAERAIGELRKQREELKKTLSLPGLASTTNPMGPNDGPQPAPASIRGGKPAAGSRQQSEVERYLENLRRQLEATQNLTVYEQLLVDLRKDGLSKATAGQRAELESLAQRIDLSRANESQLQAEERQMADLRAEQDKLRQAGIAIYDATRTPLERLNAEQDRLNKLLEKGVLSWDTYTRALFDASEAYDQAIGNGAPKQIQKMTSAAEELGMSFKSAFEDAVIEGKKFSDVLQGLAKDITRIILRRNVTEPLAAAIGEFNWGSLFGGIFGARANGGPVTAGAPYIVGERGPEMFVPSTSGKVLPNHALRGGSDQPVNIKVVNNTGTPATARQQRGPDGIEIILDAVQDDIARGGKVASQMQQTYGLQRGAGVWRRS